jgi:hypothetical protein
MRIHHTQTKAAAKLGVEIVILGDGSFVLRGDNGPVAQSADLKTLLAAYAKYVDHDGEYDPPAGVEFLDGEEDIEGDDAVDPDEAADAEGDDEEDNRHPLVKQMEKYKELYSQHDDSNGDKYADAFRAFVIDEESGELDYNKLMTVARANGKSLAKYSREKRGWQGRHRMVLGNMLRAMIRRGDDVVIGDKTFKGDKVEPKAKPAKKPAKAKKAA